MSWDYWFRHKNFNHQYCLTAKQYAKRFGFPLLGDFELRGTPDDISRLAQVIMEASSRHSSNS
ncbi:NrdI protein [Streptococcus pyogenes MGAS2096]|nr:NrdI protein [Streptococcus pyogenes MGAS2096]